VDSDGALSNIATVTITVAAAPPGSVYLIPDACHPGELALVVNGSSGDDTIHITPTTGGLSVTVNGVSQTFNPTGRIIVFAYGSNDWVQLAGAISNQAWLYGDDGDDYLNLGNGGGISFGGNGDDHLVGGTSRDILVGGDGGDRLVGNSGDDLMIASSSLYDDRFTRPDHEAAWCAIYHEWSRTDHTYQQRVDNIFDGSGTVDRDNGPYFLNTSTVIDDNDEDKLTGSAALDWFFANLAGSGVRDTVTDLKSSEVAEDV
jgi:Ca2+-binding RTX toxin-like protein